MAIIPQDLPQDEQIVMLSTLAATLRDVKTYIDKQDSAGSSDADAKIKAVSDKLDALIGADEGDLDDVINTFNEVKAFLADYGEDDTLKALIDSVDRAITAENERAESAERALGDRITTLENVPVLTPQQARDMFNSIFNE